MNYKLPEAPKAAGNYVTVKKIGDFIYTSGHVPITDEKKIIGKIPNEISIEEGYDAASLCAELTIASLLTISDIKKIDSCKCTRICKFFIGLYRSTKSIKWVY